MTKIEPTSGYLVVDHHEALPDPEEDACAGSAVVGVCSAAPALEGGNGGLAAVAVAADDGPAHQAQHGGLALSCHGVAAREVGRQVHQVRVVPGEGDEAAPPVLIRGKLGQRIDGLGDMTWRHCLSSHVQGEFYETSGSVFTRLLLQQVVQNVGRGWIVQQLF